LNEGLGLRLGAPFIVLIAILLSIGQLGLRRMQTIDEALPDITGRQSANLQIARRALMISNDNNRIAMEIVLVENRALVETLVATSSANSREITRLIEESESRCQSDQERHLLSAVKESRKLYLESAQRAIRLIIDERQHAEAETVMVNEALPSLLKYQAAWDAFVEFQKDELDDAVRQAQVDYARARRLNSLLIGLAVFLAIVIAIFTTRRTAREMIARGAAQNEVSQLNATLEERVVQRTNELSEVTEHFNLRVAALEAAANAIVITDSRDAILWVNHAFTSMTGYSKDEVLGKNPRLFMSGDQPENRYAEVWSTVSSGEVWKGESVNRRKDGTTYPEEVTITPVNPDVNSPGNRYFISIKQDITDRRRAQDAIAKSEGRYRSLFENMLEGFAYCEMLFDDLGRPIDFVYLAVNSTFGKLTGLSNVVGKKFTEVIPESKESAELFERYSRVILTLKPERFDIEIKALGMWFSISAYGVENGCFIATFDNITERKRVEESLLFKTVLLEAQAETTIDGILIVDESDRIVLANRQLGLQFGIPSKLLATGDDRILLEYVLTNVEAPEPFVERVKYLYSHRSEKSRDEFKLKNGKVFDRYSAPLIDSRKQYRGRIWYFRDITDRKVAEERIQYLAYYDALTGLPNRILLHDRLTKTLAGARRQKDRVALLFLDLDGFKNINDSLGHAFGDLLLQEVALRLKTWGREQDTVARLGGDEFLIMLTDVKDLPDVAVATERLMDAMTAPFLVQGHSLNIGCCIGISVFPEHGGDGDTLISRADAAMYSAKEYGRDHFRFFTEEMNTQVLERLTLENSLRLALKNEELFLVYQPQMDIATGRVTGLEALLRWQHPDLGLVPPNKFIPIAENSGLIVPIGEWVLRTACDQAKKWQEHGLPAVTVAVNVSAIQFRQEGFCELIRNVLRDTGLSPQYLELELTESLLLANADLMLSVVQELKVIGLTLAIDDFGTGYSSFAYLRQFRVSKLKIDRMFVRDVAVNPDDAAITAAIISMAKSLRLKVIAEGVEDEAQMSFLQAHHCDAIQGYFFSKPLAVDDVAAKLRADSTKLQVAGNPVGDSCDDNRHDVHISLMSIGLALLVSADPVTIQQFSLALRELSISPDACQDAAGAAILLKRKKFDAVIIDLKLGKQSGLILDEVHLSASNGTAVTFAISNHDAESTAAFRKKPQFVFERPLSLQSINKTLKPAFGLILRERRRYFRCPVSIPVVIQREGGQEIRCNSVNISGGGMALNTQVPLVPGESVRVRFTLPDHDAPFVAGSTLCWSKTGQLGIRFMSISGDHKSELEAWLSHKLEETLPDFVAEQFRKAELVSSHTQN
jgi:diguanylate cyclase (GGDEF)-like protein/PAS domain S-box-containing protein